MAESLAQVNRLYHVVSSQLSAVQAIGYYVFIRTPRDVVILCFNLQKQMICLPLRCVKKVYDTTWNILSLFRSNPNVTPSVTEVLTGTSDPDMQQVLQAAREIRATALNTISNQTSNRRLMKYREALDKWAIDSDRKINETMAVGVEEKNIVNKLAQTITFLRKIKARKAKLTESVCDNIVSMVSKDGVSQNDFQLIKKNFKNLSSLNSTLHEERKGCLKYFNNTNRTSQVFAKAVLQCEGLYDFNPGCEVDNAMLHKMLVMYEKVRPEKSTRNQTGEKLEEILNVTESIKKLLLEFSDQVAGRANNDLVLLREKLDEQQIMLRSVQEERNLMQQKLDILEMMIQDQERFLDIHSAEKFINAEADSVGSSNLQCTSVY